MDGEGTAAYPTTSSRPPARGSPWLLSERLGAGSTVVALQETDEQRINSRASLLWSPANTGLGDWRHTMKPSHRHRHLRLAHNHQQPHLPLSRDSNTDVQCRGQREAALQLRPCPFLRKGTFLFNRFASLVAQTVKNLSAMQETRVRALVRKILWRRGWQSTSLFLPGKSHGQRSLAGYHNPQGRKKSRHLTKAAAAYPTPSKRKCIC